MSNNFRVLSILEHVHGDVDRLDNRICIFFDPKEDNFFYYGTRNTDGKTKYVNYEGYYSSNKVDSLVNFLTFIFGDNKEVFTTELHYLNIPDKEYNILNYTKITNKMTNKSLLAAYDMKSETRYTFSEYLDFLVPN